MQFVLHCLATGDKSVLHLAVKRFHVSVQERRIGLVFDMTRRTEAAVVGQADLLAEAHVHFEGHKTA